MMLLLDMRVPMFGAEFTFAPSISNPIAFPRLNGLQAPFPFVSEFFIRLAATLEFISDPAFSSGLTLESGVTAGALSSKIPKPTNTEKNGIANVFSNDGVSSSAQFFKIKSKKYVNNETKIYD